MQGTGVRDRDASVVWPEPCTRTGRPGLTLSLFQFDRPVSYPRGGERAAVHAGMGCMLAVDIGGGDTKGIYMVSLESGLSVALTALRVARSLGERQRWRGDPKDSTLSLWDGPRLEEQLEEEVRQSIGGRALFRLGPGSSFAGTH